MDKVIELQKVLLPKYLPENGEITNIRSQLLTTAGENYGSVLLALEIEITAKNERKTIQCVAKTVPQNDFVKEFFSSEATFKKELGFYDSIAPTLRDFQREQGAENCIDCIATFYGGRLSLDKSLEGFDKHAVILMENLKVEGYGTVPRVIGFDFSTAKLIVKNLAVFHALPIGVKLLKPEEFQIKILPYLNYVELFANISDELGKKLLEDIVSILKENPECHQYIDRVVTKFIESNNLTFRTSEAKEPFATVTHNDFWVNNIMVKRNGGDRVDSIKIIDFQFTAYGSPAKDLLFFIFNNVQNDVIVSHFDELLQTYHESFMQTLQEIKVDTSEYTMEKFLEEIEHCVNNTILILQCLVMLRPIFAVKEGVNEVEKLTAENIIKFCEPTREHKEKLYVMVEQFAKRNWI